MADNGLFMRSRDECFYNTRTKYYRSDDGSLIPYETMIASRQVFAESGLELSDWSKDFIKRLEYREAAAEIFGDKPSCSRGFVPEPLSRQEVLDSSRRRARRKIFDYCICNDFDLFITVTLDKDLIDRDSYGAVIKKLNSWLGNRVRRKGLKYIGVPEYHKNGGLHFHFACTSSAFKLVDSGCVTVEGIKKPMRAETARRRGYVGDTVHKVYNVADWKLGFSTAIYRYGSRGCFAQYLAKELCKDVQKKLVNEGSIDKIGGRWYLHGGKLDMPICKYTNVNYHDIDGFSYAVSTDGGDFKVFKFNDNGVVLR